MAKAPDPHNYVVRLGDHYAVIWNDEMHSKHAKAKQANIALWQLKKIQKETGAEPMPSSRLDRLVQDDFFEREPEVERPRVMRNLPCPDCDGKLYLRSGKFGLFYGCENYSTTLCRGSVSADSKGIPMGIPVNAATRRARHVLRKAYAWLQENGHAFPQNQRLYDHDLDTCRAELSDLCEQFPPLVGFVDQLPDHIQRTRLERLVSNTDRLDEMLGLVGVEAEG